MGATWVSWKATIAVIITVLQIRALISVKTTVVTGVEGQRFDFRCEYPSRWQNNAKYFCHDDDNDTFSHLIWTDKHNKWEEEGRFSVYDNTTGSFFIVRVDELSSDDSGTYWCGVDVSFLPDHISAIHLNVSREMNLSLFLTAAMCVAAMLFVCLFTFGLLVAVKQRRPGPHQNKETSSDYETMMPGVRTEPEICCSCSAPDCSDLSALPPPPVDFYPYSTSKNRESFVSLGLSEYVDVDVPGHICRYQHLDLSRLEEHVYHSLHGNSSPKCGLANVDPNPAIEQINC